MEMLQEYSAAADMDSLNLPQQQTQPAPGEETLQGDLDPERADFLEQSIPTESACSDISLMKVPNPTQELAQTSLLQAPFSAQPMLQAQQLPQMAGLVSREILNQRTQQLIDDINAKRKRDTSLLADFKKDIELQASNSYDSLEQAMFRMYEGNGKVIQEKLQDLFATLDRISTLEMELEQFRTCLGALYSEVQGPSAAARPT